MSAVSNSVTIEKRDSNGKRVLWNTTKAMGAFRDPDITLVRTIGANGPATTKFAVSNALSYFILQTYGGSNPREEISIKNNVIDLSKNYSSAADTSPNGYLYLSDLNTTSFKIEFTSAGTTFSGGAFSFNRVFPNLKTIEAAVSLGSYRFGFGSSQDWSKLPSLAYFYGNHSASLANCPTLRNGMIGSMDQEISLKNNYTSLRRLYTLSGGTWQIANFFNGNPLRSSLFISTPNGGTTLSVRYTAKADFPLVIGQDSDYPLSYIMDVAGSGSNTTAMPPDEISQLIIDFANKVTAVNINVKLIRIKGSPNQSYTDPSQLTYKTYTAALARVINSTGSAGLGCTITYV